MMRRVVQAVGYAVPWALFSMSLYLWLVPLVTLVRMGEDGLVPYVIIITLIAVCSTYLSLVARDVDLST